MELQGNFLDLQRHVDEMRASWQGRVLMLAEGRVLVALTSMLAHTYDEAMPTLLRAVNPKCWDAERQSLKTPFLCSIGKINKAGRIVADVIMRDFELPRRNVVMFSDERDFQNELRKLADRARLSDAERIEFFKVARRWCASDQRLDPTMNPKDPDAKRLVVH